MKQIATTEQLKQEFRQVSQCIDSAKGHTSTLKAVTSSLLYINRRVWTSNAGEDCTEATGTGHREPLESISLPLKRLSYTSSLLFYVPLPGRVDFLGCLRVRYTASARTEIPGRNYAK